MKYYCIGIKGSGMSTLAQILYDMGNEVSGYDDTIDYKFTQKGLDDRNIKIYHDSTHDIDKDTIVTYSVALPLTHKEMVRVKDLGLTIKKYNEIIGDIIEQFDTIGVSGTHGKTTTSSIIRHILENTLGTNYFIGSGDGYVNSRNKYFVVESDEFNRHFTVYHPNYSVITNIEAEHLECYKDIDDIRETFNIFANNTKKLVVANGDNEEVRKLNIKTKFVLYGFNDNNNIVIKDMELTSNGSKFSLYENKELLGTFDIPLYGKHNVMNATAAIYIAYKLGIDLKKIERVLKTFKNASRRFAIEEINGHILIDDYAHHPTEIEVTLKAVRQKYPDKKITVVFRPNTYSRTKDFKDEFISSLSIADKVFLTEIMCNREKQEDYPGISSQSIIDGIKDAEIIDEETIEKLIPYEDTVVVFMGCADVSHLISNYKELL